MAWIEPKTDWTSADFFNAEDYNRIIGNITHLKALGDDLFSGLSNLSMGEEKSVMSLIYAREMNNIENALESLNLETYNLGIGDKQTFKANGSTPLWSEFNRIESAILLLYNTMVVHKDNLPRLDFRLGNQKGIRV